MEELAVDADVVLVRVGAGAELGDGGAVDLNAAFEDDLLGLAAGGDAGLREDLLEAFAGGAFFGRGHASIMTGRCGGEDGRRPGGGRDAGQLAVATGRPRRLTIESFSSLRILRACPLACADHGPTGSRRE